MPRRMPQAAQRSAQVNLERLMIFAGTLHSFVWGTPAQVVAPRRDALAKDRQHAGVRFVIISKTLLLNACTAHGPSAPAMNLAHDQMREECSMAHTCTA